MAVEAHAGDAGGEGDQSFPQCLFVPCPFFQLLIGEPGRLPEAHDTRDVLGAAPQSLLLAAPEEDRLEVDATACVQGADALRTVELVGREGERGDWYARD